MIANGCEVSFQGNGNVQQSGSGDGCTADVLTATDLYTSAGACMWDCVHCEFYLNKAVILKNTVAISVLWWFQCSLYFIVRSI